MERVFTKFLQLPSELRMLIWQFVAHQPRIIDLRPNSPRVNLDNPVPSVLHASSEARKTAQRHYEIISMSTFRCAELDERCLHIPFLWEDVPQPYNACTTRWVADNPPPFHVLSPRLLSHQLKKEKNLLNFRGLHIVNFSADIFWIKGAVSGFKWHLRKRDMDRIQRVQFDFRHRCRNIGTDFFPREFGKLREITAVVGEESMEEQQDNTNRKRLISEDLKKWFIRATDYLPYDQIELKFALTPSCNILDPWYLDSTNADQTMRREIHYALHGDTSCCQISWPKGFKEPISADHYCHDDSANAPCKYSVTLIRA